MWKKLKGLKRVNVVKGYTGLARFYAELGKCLGYIPRQSYIPSPYAFSPTHIVFARDESAVIIVETRHLRHEVFEVPDDLIHATEETILET